MRPLCLRHSRGRRQLLICLHSHFASMHAKLRTSKRWWGRQFEIPCHADPLGTVRNGQTRHFRRIPWWKYLGCHRCCPIIAPMSRRCL